MTTHKTNNTPIYIKQSNEQQHLISFFPKTKKASCDSFFEPVHLREASE